MPPTKTLTAASMSTVDKLVGLLEVSQEAHSALTYLYQLLVENEELRQTVLNQQGQIEELQAGSQKWGIFTKK